MVARPAPAAIPRSSPIVNLTRSGRRTELTRVLLDADAPPGIKDAVQAALDAHVAGPGRGDFYGEPRVRFSAVTEEGKIKIVVVWTYAYGGAAPPVAEQRTGQAAQVGRLRARCGDGKLPGTAGCRGETDEQPPPPARLPHDSD